MRGDELLELTDELRVSAQRELSVDPSLEGGKPNLLEALDRDPCERLVRKIGESSAAPEPERLPQQLCRLLRRSSCPDLSGTLRQPLEAMQVELIGGEAQDVTGRTRLDRRRAEDPPQLGDLALHLRDGRDGGSAVVEIIGEPLDRDDPVRPSRRIARVARCFGPPSGIGPSSPTTSSGPRRQNSSTPRTVTVR